MIDENTHDYDDDVDAVASHSLDMQFKATAWTFFLPHVFPVLTVSVSPYDFFCGFS
jgi:hypothetical protein